MRGTLARRRQERAPDAVQRHRQLPQPLFPDRELPHASRDSRHDMPLVILVTMRGEFAEFVPWQIPMGKRTPAALELMQFDVFRVEEAAVTGDIVSGAIDHAFFSKRSVARALNAL